MTASYLADASIFRRLSSAPVADRFREFAKEGALATCGVVDLAVASGVMPNADLAHVVDIYRAALSRVRCDDADLCRAHEVLLSLGRQGLRVGAWWELVVAAVAESHQLTVLHYSASFDRIAKETGQATEWIVPTGSAD